MQSIGLAVSGILGVTFAALLILFGVHTAIKVHPLAIYLISYLVFVAVYLVASCYIQERNREKQ